MCDIFRALEVAGAHQRRVAPGNAGGLMALTYLVAGKKHASYLKSSQTLMKPFSGEAFELSLTIEQLEAS